MNPSPIEASGGLLDRLERITALPTPAVSASDATHLVVIRESTKYDASLLHGMAIQTVSACLRANVRGAEEMLAGCGDSPKSFLPWLRTAKGDEWRARHRARTLYEPGGRAYGFLVEVQGTHFLLAATSATSEVDEDLTNPFTTDLIQLVERLTPDHLWTGPASRLMRRRDHAMQLQRAVSRARVIVHTQMGEFDFRAQRQVAEQNWQMAADFSHREVQAILQRTTLGRIHAVRSGRWPEAERNLPGIHLALDRDRRLVVDASDSTRTVAAALVRVVADAARNGDELTSDVSLRIAKAISDAGARSADGRRRVDEMADPTNAVATRLRQLMVAAAGRYDRLQKLPVSDWTEQELLVPVYRHPDTGDRCVLLCSVFPTLIEAYDELDLEEVAAAIAWIRQRSAQVVPPDLRENRLPLGEVRVLVDGAPTGRARSMMREGDRYVVREHPEGTSPRGQDVDSVIVASLPWRVLHRAVVDGVQQAAANDLLPIDDSLLPHRLEVETAPSAEERELQARHRSLDETAAQLVAKADGLPEHLAREVRAVVEPDIAQLQAEQALIEERLASLEADRTLQAEATLQTVESVTDLLALLETTGPMPPGLRRLVRRHLPELRITPADDGTSTVRGSVRLQLPSGDGLPLITAPIEWQAKDNRKGYLIKDGRIRRDRKQRIEFPAALHRRLTEDASAADLLDVDEHRARRHMLDLLTASSSAYASSASAMAPAPASALVDAGPLSTRRSVYTLLGERSGLPWQGVTWPDGDLPQPPSLPTTVEDLNPERTAAWLEHLALIYLDAPADDAAKGCGWSRGGERARRSIIKALQAEGGTMPADRLGQLLALSRPIRTAADARQSFRRYTMLEVTGDARAPLVGLKTCPWDRCGSTDWQTLNVPEVPGGLICRNCRRSPELPDVYFPESYLLEWEGPARDSRDKTSSRPAGAVGTILATTPARAAAAVRRSPVLAAGSADRCGFVPHVEEGPCGHMPTSGQWCPAHDDRNKRKRARTAARISRRNCAVDGCLSPITYSGAGRPPSRCLDHHAKNS